MGARGQRFFVCHRARGRDARGILGVRRGEGLPPERILERAGLELARERRRGASLVLEARGSGTLAAPKFRSLGGTGAAPPCSARELVGGRSVLPLGETPIANRDRVGSGCGGRTGGFGQGTRGREASVPVG